MFLPGFIAYSGALISDVLGPTSVTILILHVGTNDVAQTGALNGLAKYRVLLGESRCRRPEFLSIYVSLLLPRCSSLGRRSFNQSFVKWFNSEESEFNLYLLILCGRGRPRTFYTNHRFEYLTARRVLLVDCFHPSYESVIILAVHLKATLRRN